MRPPRGGNREHYDRPQLHVGEDYAENDHDFYEDRGRHFDDIEVTRNSENLYGHVRQCIDQLAREAWLPAIYNCNPRSNLKCFPFMSFEAALHASCLETT